MAHFILFLNYLFQLEANYFTILWWFLPYIDMNQPCVYMCSPILKPPSHLPPHSIPLGCPRAPALGSLLHASNLHWSSLLHMVIQMFQCSSLKSSHSCLLPQSAKIIFLCLCFFCCFAYRIVVNVFLNSIYMC